jgi:hypothetical protein
MIEAGLQSLSSSDPIQRSEHAITSMAMSFRHTRCRVLGRAIEARDREKDRAYGLRASGAKQDNLFGKATPRRGRSIDSIGRVRPLVPCGGGKFGRAS